MDGDLPLPKGVKRRRSPAEIIAFIDGLPDTGLVSTYEAAVYLDVYTKTLLRWRSGYKRKGYVPKQKSDGQPDKFLVAPVEGAPLAGKYPAGNSKAQNQHLHWLVGDLKRFVRERAKRSTFEAAVMNRTGFASRLDQLSQERPWFAEGGTIVDEATSAPKAVFDAWKRRDGSIELLTLSIVEAMCDFEWQKSETRAPWDTYFRDEMRAFADAAESTSSARQQSVRFKEHPASPGGHTPARARPRS